jgi:hypothetical protein
MDDATPLHHAVVCGNPPNSQPATQTRTPKTNPRYDAKRMRLVEPIETLPAEILMLVFEWLPWSDLLKVGAVCRNWCSMSSGRYAFFFFFFFFVLLCTLSSPLVLSWRADDGER